MEEYVYDEDAYAMSLDFYRIMGSANHDMLFEVLSHCGRIGRSGRCHIALSAWTQLRPAICCQMAFV